MPIFLLAVGAVAALAAGAGAYYLSRPRYMIPVPYPYYPAYYYPPAWPAPRVYYTF